MEETLPGTVDAFYAQATAVATGRKRLFHDTFDDEEGRRIFEVLAQTLPPEVSVDFTDGHLHVWRRDLIPETVEELIALAREHRNGLLLGYGQPTMGLWDPKTVQVGLWDVMHDKVGGFMAPRHAAAVFARARARDLADAWGEPVQYTINKKGGPA